MPDVIPFQLVFAASIDSVNISNSTPVKGGSLIDIGPGLSQIILNDGGISASESITSITAREVSGSGRISHSNDIIKIIIMVNPAGVSVDLNTDILIFRII